MQSQYHGQQRCRSCGSINLTHNIKTGHHYCWRCLDCGRQSLQTPEYVLGNSSGIIDAVRLFIFMLLLSSICWLLFNTRVALSWVDQNISIVVSVCVIFTLVFGVVIGLKRRSLVSIAPLTEQAQIFISYKSENTREARQLAEALMLAGGRVWLDQYKIPLEERLEEEAFQEYLDQGIAECNFAIFMTNQRYSQSDWCAYEISTILAKYDKANLIEVLIPGDHHFFDLGSKLDKKLHSNLQMVKKIQWKGDPDQIVSLCCMQRFVDDKAEGRVVLIPSFNTGSGSEYIGFNSLNVRFPKGAWKTVWTTPGPSPQHILQCDFEAGVNGVLHILTQRTYAHERKDNYCDNTEDDRGVFNTNLRVARAHFQGMTKGFDYDLLGIHMFKLLGYSHLATTYRIKKSGKSMIMRKYVITLQDKITQNDVDIILTFRIKGPRTDFVEFLRYGVCFDAFVEAIETIAH